MVPEILGNYYFSHTSVMLIDKVVSYNHHIVWAVLHNVPVVYIVLGQPPLSNKVHDLVLDNHIFEHRVVGMEPVSTMHASLVEVDILVVGVEGTVDNVEAIMLCVGVVFVQVV